MHYQFAQTFENVKVSFAMAKERLFYDYVAIGWAFSRLVLRAVCFRLSARSYMHLFRKGMRPYK